MGTGIRIPGKTASAIQETSGPTVLPVRDVADGQYLKRVGDEIVGAAGGGGGGGATAAGAAGDVQFNDGAGDLAADSKFNYNNGTDTLTMPGIVISEDVRFTGVISPTQLSGDVNNYNPTNLATSAALRLSSDAERTITGLQGGVAGRVLNLINVGAFPIILAHASGSSSAANQFSLGGADVAIFPGRAASIVYDSTTTCWRMSSTTAPDATETESGFMSYADKSLFVSFQSDSAFWPSSDEKDALAGTDGTPNAGNPYVTDSDARLTDARAPEGAAGGGLGGNYPNPTVNGLTSGVLTNDAAHGNRGNGSLHSVADGSNAGFMSSANFTKMSNLVYGRLYLDAAALYETNTSDWAVNGGAGVVTDPTNSGFMMRSFVEASETGVGFRWRTPTGTTSFRFTFNTRAQSAPGGAVQAQLTWYVRELVSGSAWGAWSSGVDFTPFDYTTNTNPVDDTETITLATLGLTAGREFQMQITRQPADGDDGLTGNLLLGSIQLEAI